MNCNDTLELLSSRLDGELQADLLVRVEEHLASCAACRAEAEALSRQDSQMRAEFAARAARVAAATIQAATIAAATRTALEFSAHEETPASASSAFASSAIVPAWPLSEGGKPDRGSDRAPRDSAPRWRSAVTHALCAAGGFALAVLALRPASPPVDGGAAAVAPAPTVEAAPAATLVLATGPVEYRPFESSAWSTCPPGFVCPSSASVRTKDDALCELKTNEECVVRLDRATELAFGPEGRLTLRQGKVWCRVPPGQQLEVHAATRGEQPPTDPFSCTGRGATWSVGWSEQQLECLSAAGNVVVDAGGEERTLAPGQALRIGGGAPADPFRVDQLAAARWMWPLLVRRGAENTELETQIHALLSTVGRTKVSHLSEFEIRRLGEYGALPVLRFVQRADPQTDAAQREAAMRILADVAPVSFVPEMIDLLADSSPHVRVSAARGLLRLTGETQGRRPEDWKMPIPADDAILIAWRVWWDQNRALQPLGVGRGS